MNFIFKKRCLIISNNGNLFVSTVRKIVQTKIKKAKQNRLMLLSNCAICGKKN